MVSGTVSVSGNTATFTPTASLVGNTQYTATVTSAAKDAAGNALAANYTWSFTTDAASGLSYSTTFPSTEGVLSEGGNWINSVGGTWKNPVSTVGGSPGHAVGLTSQGFNDSVAVLVGAYGLNQTITGTAYHTGSLTAAEIELHLRMTMIPAGSGLPDQIFTYEIDIVPGASYIQIVKWQGPQNTYTVLASGRISGIADGDVFVASAIGGASNTVITVSKNGTTVVTYTDTAAYTTGNPGIGMDAGNTTDGANFGWKSYSVVTN